MRKPVSLFLLGGCLALLPGQEGTAQESPAFLSVGEMAPDFQVVGATRHGVLADPISLSDLRGETVVLAFFFKVRTGG
jgi:peroxiredoxin Q/BCP